MLHITSYCGENWDDVVDHTMFLKVIGMAKALSCALQKMAEHHFTSLREVPLHHSSIADRIFWILGAVVPDFLFMNGNACLHRTADVSHTLESENIERLE